MFPPDFVFAMKLFLLNEPYYHASLTVTSTVEQLKREGDFLIQDNPNSSTVILSVFNDGVREFLIKIKLTPSGVKLSLGGFFFGTLDELINRLRTTPLMSGGRRIILGTAVCKSKVANRFGSSSILMCPPRYTLKAFVPLINKVTSSRAVALKKEATYKSIEDELELLMKLKHRSLISLLDFASYPNGLSQIIILRYQHYKTSLYDYIRTTRITRANIMKWSNQATLAAHYLSLNNCFSTILCAQDCYLDDGNNLKVGGAWMGKWKYGLDDIVNHDWYWRFIAPETLAWKVCSSSSLVWNLGVFIWQLTTLCYFLPFPQFLSRRSYLEAINNRKLVLFNNQNKDLLENYSLEIRSRVYEQYYELNKGCTQIPINIENKMDGEGPSGVSGSLESFSDDMLFGGEGFDILESGGSLGSNREVDGMPGLMISSRQQHQDDVSWMNLKGTTSGIELRDSKCFRTPQGFQKTATFLCHQLYEQRSYMDETRRAVNSVAEDSLMMVDQDQEEGISPLTDEPTPGPSSTEPLRKPLERLTLMIGQKVLRFKVMKNDEVQNTSGQSRLTTLFKCIHCKRMFTAKDEWNKHMTSFHGTKEINCAHCGAGFASKVSLGIHMRSHNHPKHYQCSICSKTFSRSSNFNLHLKMHQTGQRHFCQICGRCFKSMQLMIEHQHSCVAMINGEFIPTDRPLRFQCTFCEKMFHHRRDKNIHERVHTGEKPYTCGYCGRGFTQSQALTIHIRTHTGEKPYACMICGKDFRDSSALRKHEYKHNAPTEISALYDDPPSELDTGLLDDYEPSLWGERN